MDSPDSTGKGRKVLVVFWEGADWSLLLPFLQEGLLPNLRGLIDRGNKGSVLSHFPFRATPLFVNALSGTRVWQHGVSAQTEQTPRLPLLWDALPSGTAIVVNAPDACKSDNPRVQCLTQSHLGSAQALSRTPTGEDLSDLFVAPTDLDSSLLRLLCPDISAAVANNDPLIQLLADQLARHYTKHNIAASLLETQPWALAVLRFDFLENVFKRFSAYATPDAQDVPAAYRKRYGSVIKGACRLMDFLLGDILQTAGDSTCFLLSTRGLPVLSEQAAHSYPLTPPGTGFLIASGQGLTQGVNIGTVSVLDLMPTLRHFWNLPKRTDLPGRIWEEILSDAPQAIANTGEHRNAPEHTLSPKLPPPSQLSPREAFALGVDLYEDGSPQNALPFLQHATLLAPEKPEHAFWLSCAQAALGHHAASAQSEDVMLTYLSRDTRPTLYRQALLASQRGQLLRVVSLLENPAKEGTLPAPISSCYVRALMESNQWHQALEFLTAQLEQQQSHDAWLGLARCYLQFNRFEDAEAAARHVLNSNPGLAEASAMLALALHGQNRGSEAHNALSQAEKLASDWPMVRQARARLTGTTFKPNQTQAVEAIAPLSTYQSSQKPSFEFDFRHPEPAEQNRFQDFLLAPLLDGTHWEKRVWIRNHPYSHITGAAAWVLPEGETEAKVALRLCSKWREETGRNDRMLPLFNALAQAGARQAVLTSLDPVKWIHLLPVGQLLQYTTWTSEEWLGDPVRTAEALKPYHPIEADAFNRGWRLHPLCQKDWFLAREWGPDREFLEPEHFEAVRAKADAELSAVLEAPDGTVAGLLLVTRTIRLARIEFVTGNPDKDDYWPLCTLCLFGHLTRLALQSEAYDVFTLTTNLNHGHAMHRLAQRLAMTRTREQSHAHVFWRTSST